MNRKLIIDGNAVYEIDEDESKNSHQDKRKEAE